MLRTEKNESHWTEGELDSALRGLSAELNLDDITMGRLRSATMSGADVVGAGDPGAVAVDTPSFASARSQRPLVSRRRIIGATAVVAAAAAAFAVGVVSFGPATPSASAQAADVLRSAAAAIRPDPQPGPGQYRRITTHAWYLNGVVDVRAGSNAHPKTITWLGEAVDTIWAPARYEDTWLMRRKTTGNVRWLQPTSAPSPLPEMAAPSTFERSAPCGGFIDDKGCAAVGSWEGPTRAWIAGLPRDPVKLFDRLRHDAARNGRGDAELIAVAADALNSGMLPADLQVALYKALTRIDDLVVTHDRVTVDGRSGTGLGVDDGNTVEEIIIDSKTGEYIGGRDVFSRAINGLPAGTVDASSSVKVDITSTRG